MSSRFATPVLDHPICALPTRACRRAIARERVPSGSGGGGGGASVAPPAVPPTFPLSRISCTHTISPPTLLKNNIPNHRRRGTQRRRRH